MTEQLTCIRCRQCQLLPETDIKQPSPVVFCHKKGERSPLILSGCALSNPSRHNVRQGLHGDRTRNASPVELAWLSAHYARTPMERLQQVTGRNYTALKNLAARHGWKREGWRPAMQAKGCATRRRTNHFLNDQQRLYLIERYKVGPWPARGGRKDIPAQRKYLERQQAIRQEILDDIARLGRPFKWGTLQGYLYRQSPACTKR